MSEIAAGTGTAVSNSSNTRRTTKQRAIVEVVGIVIALAIVVLLLELAAHGVIPSQYIVPTYLAIGVGIAGYLLIRVATVLLERSVESTIGVTRTQAIKNILELAGGVFVIVVAFGIFGLNLTSILVGAGFAGIVLGLAAQQVLGNVFAGLSLLISRPFDIGDRVTIVNGSYGLLGPSYPHEAEINGFTGVVEDVGIFLTRVLLDAGTPSIFPNSSMISSMIINHSKVTSRTVRVRLSLERDGIDFVDFRSTLLDSLRQHTDLIDIEKSRIEIVDLDSKAYSVIVAVWARSNLEEPIKTLVIRDAMNVQKQLTKLPPSHL